MRLYCKACNNELTGTLIPAAPEQAYSKELTDPEFDIHKYRMLPGLFYKDTRPVCWSHDETTGDSTPSGDVKDYHAMRYQALFARAQQVGGIAIGTTNRDELEYAGWFGKNSDMVTDMQFLWRLPKCLVLDFARELQVPDAIINRVPVGDLIDGSSDEQNFGCTYDELRWYTDIGRTHRVKRVGEHTEFMLRKFDKLEELHRKNSHKYATKGITSYNPVFI